jgi:high-affinity iron transporter
LKVEVRRPTLVPGLPWFLAGVLAAGAIVLVAALVIAPGLLSHREGYLPGRVLQKLSEEFAAPPTERGSGKAGPANADTLARGRALYAQACAACHGAEGAGDGFWGKGLYPNATDLRAHDAQEKSDRQLVTIIRDGISFGGMPGFGNVYDEAQTRDLIAYMRTLAADGGGAR